MMRATRVGPDVVMDAAIAQAITTGRDPRAVRRQWGRGGALPPSGVTLRTPAIAPPYATMCGMRCTSRHDYPYVSRMHARILRRARHGYLHAHLEHRERQARPRVARPISVSVPPSIEARSDVISR